MSTVFAHGQLRLYVLSVLADGPKHGYEIIRELEQRFEGLYTPSAGTVYPRLSRLEEEGLVVREDEGRKAIYRITEAGRAEVSARRGEMQDLQVDLDRTVQRMAEELRTQVKGGSKDLRAELADAARAARRRARNQPTDSPHPGLLPQVDQAVDQLRRGLRSAMRRQSVDPTALHEIVGILERTRDEVLGVVDRARSPRSPQDRPPTDGPS